VDRIEDKRKTEVYPLDQPTITAVTENPSAPLSLLESLAAQSDSPWVWHATLALRQRQGMPDPEALLGENCWFSFFCGKSTAYLNTNWTDGLWPLLPEGALVHLAGNVAAPAEYLERLSRSEFTSVRAMVAGNIATPLNILARLAGDDKDTVRHCLARNPSCPADLLAILAEDLYEKVRTAALERLRERQKA
jgi:hypothetical protein